MKMNNYSDEDLLVMTSFQKENEKEAKEAFTIFYNRYKQFLWNLCCKVCDDTELAKDVMQETWIAIYKSSHTYNSKKGNVKTWMSRIAENKMKDLLKTNNEFLQLNEDIDFPDIDNEEENNIPSPGKKELDKALDALPEREKYILLTYMRYFDGKKHLPDEVIRELCQRYSTTVDNLHQIKKRAFDKVRNLIFSNQSVLTHKK